MSSDEITTSNPSSPSRSHDFAVQLEEGNSPTIPQSSHHDEERDAFDEKLDLRSPPTFKSRSSTFVAATTRSSLSALQKAASWTTSVGAAVLPNTSPSKADIKVSKLEDYPLGYPRVSYVLDSDDSFMMYRRFGRLHSRLLLHKQDQLRALEQELFALDRRDDLLEDTQIYLKCREEDDERDPPVRGRGRAEVLAAIEDKLLEYGRILTQANALQGLNRPTDRDHASVSNYFHNEEPLAEQDRDFLYHKEDLVTIRAGREHAWLDAAVEGFLRWYPCRPIKYLFCSEETRAKTSNSAIHYFTRSRINFVVTFLITILILVLLVVPIWILYWLTVNLNTSTTDAVCIGVLLVCTLVFSCVLSLFTKAKRHEILAAAAGYCAVLVVFVGNVGNNNGIGAN